MATAFPPPSPVFIAARHRGGRQVPKAIVIHGTVSSDNPGTARNIANWWAGSTSPVTSAHYTVDPKEVIQSVGDHTVAFHCGSNQDCIGVELCDEQTGPASRWSDADSTAILKRAARLVAELCLAYGIEVKRPSITELKMKGKHGIYGHNDSRLAFGNTSHTDPRDFPWAKFLGMVQAEVIAIRKAAEPVVEPPQAASVRRFRIGHFSMEYKDTDAQHTHDIQKIFGLGLDWLTGTEAGAGSGNMTAELQRVSSMRGYHFYRRHGEWIAVKKSLGRLVSTGTVPVLPGVKGKYGPREIPWMKLDIPNIGIVTIGASHFLTSKREGSEALNDKFQAAVTRWAQVHGAGADLVFWGADTNMIDETANVAPGLVTCWDELKKWPNTGHGNIDVIARGRRDGRVKFVKAQALRDSGFFLHGDHFGVRAAVDIELL